MARLVAQDDARPDTIYGSDSSLHFGAVNSMPSNLNLPVLTSFELQHTRGDDAGEVAGTVDELRYWADTHTRLQDKDIISIVDESKEL